MSIGQGRFDARVELNREGRSGGATAVASPRHPSRISRCPGLANGYARRIPYKEGTNGDQGWLHASHQKVLGER